MDISKKINLSVLSSCFLGVFLSSVVYDYWISSRTEQLYQVIEQQLEGKLSETARVISSVREEIKTAQAEMLSVSELREMSEFLLSQYDAKTQESISRFREETGAQITSISQRFSSIEMKLNKGKSQVGVVVSPSESPEKWGGVKTEEAGWCISAPTSCDILPFSWSSDHEINGRSIATFETENFWAQDFSLSLNLAFKVLTIGFSEAEGEGAVQNQGVHIQAGYFDKKGQFVVLSEDKLLKGNPQLDPKFFYTPKIAPKSIKTYSGLGLFTPTFVVGVGYAHPLKELGLLVGGGLLNLDKGSFRLGLNMFLHPSSVGAGVFASYHPKIALRPLNIAPMLGALIDSEISWALQAGVLFQVW
jgi:hypothetical protein